MHRHHRRLASVGLLLLGSFMLLSMAVGAGEYGLSELFGYLFGYLGGDTALHSNPHLTMILYTLRLPRTLCAVLVGSALAVAASLLQSATRNPLAEPGLLGVNAGAVLGLILGLTYAGISSSFGYLLWSAGGALLGNLLVLALGSLLSAGQPLTLILVGVALNAIFSGLSSFLLLANQAVLDQFRFWDMGSVAAVEMAALKFLLPVVLLAWLLILPVCRSLSLMQMGDTQARALGVATQRVRLIILLVVTLLTGSAVALAGPIGFLGLLAAVLARQVAPVALGRQLLFSALTGALLLLVADILARWLIQPFELADGTLLAVVGAPVLIGMVWRTRTPWLTGRAA